MRAGRAAGLPGLSARLGNWRACAVVACAAMLAPGAAHAQAAPKGAKPAPAQSVTKRLFVSGSLGGVAEIRVPAGWELSGRSTPIDLRLQRPGSRDHLRITALPVPRERLPLMTDEKLQEILRERSTRLLAVSVEKSLDLKPLGSPFGSGYYFALTDKKRVDAPDSDTDFRFLHSGMMRMGGWMAVFSIFTNNKDGVFAREALAAVATLRWHAPEPKRVAPDLFAGMRLGASPAAELKPKNELLCDSNQVHILFGKFDAAYAGLLRTRVSKTAFESFDDGQGDAGSVLYMEFAVPLAPETTSFVAGLLWGGEFPDRTHPEEFYVSGNQMVIWCTKAESRIKRLSQAKLEALLFGAK